MALSVNISLRLTSVDVVSKHSHVCLCTYIVAILNVGGTQLRTVEVLYVN